MTTFLIEAPFPTFSDTNGKPLDNGKIWIGTVDLNPKQYPAQVWWDEAMTIPAVQPIRTSGGYPVRDGTPSRIYTGAVFSITVENRQGAVVYSALNGTTTTAINTGWGGQTFTADGREGPYPLDYITPDPRAMALVLDGVWQEYETDYNFVIMPSAPSGYGVQIVGYPAPVDPIRIRVLFTADVAGTGASINGDIAQFGTRQALVDFMAAAGVVFPGFAVMAAGLIYKGQALATELPGLPGLVPVDATPGHYGAVGDDVADDRAALISAWTANRPELDHGGFTYRITDEINQVFTTPLQWKSSGATIRLDRATSKGYAVFLRIAAGRNVIAGPMKFDAGRMAHVSLRIANAVNPAVFPDDWADLVADDIWGTNAYRSSTAFQNGAGLQIGGAMNVVSLQRARATNCSMAAGAAILGSQGIHGITITRDAANNKCVRSLFMGEAYVDNVYSEDPAWTTDQDGVKIIQHFGLAGNMPYECFAVVGGTVRNSRNRSLMLQSQWVDVRDFYSFKEASADLGGTGYTNGADVYCEASGGIFRGLNYQYNGFAAAQCFQGVETVTAGEKARGISVSGVRVAVSDTLSVPALFSMRASTAINNYTAVFSDIHVAGACNYLLNATTVSGGGTAEIVMNDVFADVATAGVLMTGTGPLNVEMTEVKNVAAVAVPIIDLVNSVMTSKVVNVTGDARGFTGAVILPPGSFAARAAMVAKVAAGWVPTPGLNYTAGGLTYAGQALATELPSLPGLVPVNATPGHYGAVGDGVTNDAAALAAAWASGREIDHGSATYAFASTITATLPRIRWVSSGARLLYTGAAARYAVSLTISLGGVATLTGSGLTIDGGALAFTAFHCASAATVPDPIANWPSLNMENLHTTNYRRASLAFSGGDGIIIPGGWRSVILTNARASEGKMAVGADVAGSQGIFGITIGSGTAPQPKSILINGWSAENIWSEDASVLFDQDAMRIFQDMADPTASCKILNGDVRNVTGRAVKLHSAPNAIIDGMHRELTDSIVPQTGAYSAPDIDCQQAAATVTNCRFHYNGIWHDEIVQVTDRGAYRYGGQNVSNISWNVTNAASNAITAVRFTSSPDDGADSAFRGTVTGISGTGAINTFCAISMMGAGTNAVGLFNAVGEVKSRAVTFTGGTGTLRVAAGGIVNLGTSIEFSSARTTSWQCSVVNAYGFTGANISSDATFAAPITVDQGTAGGVIASFRGNNPRIELYDSIGSLSSGMIGQADGATIYYADYFGTAAGVSSHDFRLNGTGSGNRALVLSGADYSATFYGPVNATVGITGAGVTVSSGQMLVPDGSAAAPSMSYSTDPDCGLYRITTNQLGIATGGTRRMTINSTGTFLTPPGAYANDAGAAAGGVAIGELYRVTGGTVAWRQV